VEPGQVVGDFAFKDIRYLPRRLSDLGKKRAFVLVFTTLDCPLVQRYLPVVKTLEQEFRPQDVQFLAVNVGANDPLLEVAYQAVRVGAEFPFVKDFHGDVVRAVGVTRTPEVVVLDGERRLRYRGRIDDQFRLGGARPEAFGMPHEAADRLAAFLDAPEQAAADVPGRPGHQNTRCAGHRRPPPGHRGRALAHDPEGASAPPCAPVASRPALERARITPGCYIRRGPRPPSGVQAPLALLESRR